jgi:SAM-dependent methyltransferase
MKLIDIVRRSPDPKPWEEGQNIPWNEPAFSARMLREHLTQAHGTASRRSAKIDQHVRFIHEEVLRGRATRVLDLGCGPGLYAERLARRGHACVGIDWSPASIAHARRIAEAEALACEYVHADVRDAEFGSGFGLTMMLFGELNVFPRDEAGAILEKARAAMTSGGRLLLEVHSHTAVRAIGSQPPWWVAPESGLFGDRPHLWLRESTWSETTQAATTRHFIIDAETDDVVRHASTAQAYHDDEYLALLSGAGFEGARVVPSLIGAPDEEQRDLQVLEASVP